MKIKRLAVLFCAVAVFTSMPVFSKNKGKSAEDSNKILLETPDHKYKGSKYRSPFVPRKGGGSSTVSITYEKKEVSIRDIDTDVLKVTGYFADPDGAYAILSGGEEFYIAKKGRLYTEDNIEVKGAAAVIKKDKVLLIADDNTIYEYSMPE